MRATWEGRRGCSPRRCRNLTSRKSLIRVHEERGNEQGIARVKRVNERVKRPIDAI